MLALARLFPIGKVADNGISYNAPTAGTAVRWQGTPNRMAALVSVTAKGGADTLGAKLQTSHDGVTYLDLAESTSAVTGLSATGNSELRIVEPILEYLRFSYTESGTDCTATITSTLMADAPQTPSSTDRWDEELTTQGSFCICRDVDTVRSAAVVSATGNSDTYKISGEEEAGFFTAVVASRTQGSVTALLQFSPDAGTTWIDTDITTGAISADGTTLKRIDEPVCGLLRWKMTVASSFDGTLELKIYKSKSRSTRKRSVAG